MEVHRNPGLYILKCDDPDLVVQGKSREQLERRTADHLSIMAEHEGWETITGFIPPDEDMRHQSRLR